jgi:cobalt-zinc-cadmium efflux system outer membrane protein
MLFTTQRSATGPLARCARQRKLSVFKCAVLTSCVVAALPFSFIGLALAQPAPSPAVLTLAAAVRAAEIRSATLQGQDAAIRGLREMALSAERLPDPVLGLSVNSLPIEGANRYSLSGDFMTSSSVSLMQTFTGANKRQARSTRFEREADATASMRSVQVTSLRTHTARAWFERYYQQQTLELLQRQRAAATLVVEATEAAYRGARVGQADVFAARAAVARIDDQRHVVRADLSNAESLLERWVGAAAAQPLSSPPRIDHTPVATHDLSQQLEWHPDIVLMGAKEQVALAEADLARQEKTADWSWSLMYSKRGGQFNDMVSLGVSIPLQWDQKNRQDRVLSAKLEKVEQVRAERAEILREQRSYVQRLLASWRSALTRLDGYDQTLIPLADERSQASEAAFRGGKGALALVLEARRMEIDTRLERLRIEQQTATLWAELAFLIPDASFNTAAPAALPAISTQEYKP